MGTVRALPAQPHSFAPRSLHAVHPGHGARRSRGMPRWELVAGLPRNSPEHRYAPYHHLGRETFLCPVTWDEAGWMRVNTNGTVPLEGEGPSFFGGQRPAMAERDEIDQVELAMSWNRR